MAQQTFSEVGYPTICRPGPLAGVSRPAAVGAGVSPGYRSRSRERQCGERIIIKLALSFTLRAPLRLR